MQPEFSLPPVVRYGCAAFYGYGAWVHVANMLGLSGFGWLLAPAKWQVLDAFYLGLDLAVVAGLLTAKPWGLWALALAASSQILLYTVLRAWVLDVPATFTVAPADLAYLNGLVVFHALCLAVLGACLWHWRRHRRSVCSGHRRASSPSKS